MNLKTGVSRQQSMPNFRKNEHFLTPDSHRFVCVSGSHKCSLFGVLCFLETPVLRFTLWPYWPYYRHVISGFEKQPSRGVLRKRCYENIQQIYRTTPMSKCDFNKVAKHIFRTPYLKNTSGQMLLKLHFMFSVV